jgi:hypothetical protein
MGAKRSEEVKIAVQMVKNGATISQAAESNHVWWSSVKRALEKESWWQKKKLEKSRKDNA